MRCTNTLELSNIPTKRKQKADKYADRATKTIPKPIINKISIHNIILSIWQNHWNSILTTNEHKNRKKKTIN